jgi:hypothetical protein
MAISEEKRINGIWRKRLSASQQWLSRLAASSMAYPQPQ